MARLRAHFDGKVLVPLDRVQLPTNRILEIEVFESESAERGSPALLLRILSQPPHVPPADVDELERAIETSKLGVRYDDVFSQED